MDTVSAIPEDIIKSAIRSADIWDVPMCIGRRKETLYTARGDEFLIRKYGNSSELGVYLVVLPEYRDRSEDDMERERRTR